MANSTIPNLVAVTVPAVTDLFGVRQSGDTRDKKLTATQLLSLVPAGGDVSKVGTPVNDQVGVWTGDGTIEGTTGLRFNGTIFFNSGLGGYQITESTGNYAFATTNRPALINEAGSVTNPTLIPLLLDLDTGIGGSGADALSLIAGGVEMVRLVEAVGLEQTLILNNDNTGLPDLGSLGDPDTGWHWTTANIMAFIAGGSRAWNFSSGQFFSQFSDGPAMVNTFGAIATATFLPQRPDTDTGLGGDGNDTVSLVAGGIVGISFKELNLGVIQAPDAGVAVTAFATGGQANATQLNRSNNVLGVVATAGDSVKLPPVFLINAVMFIKNDGAEAADVFPATGDNLGAGLNTAISLAAGESASFIATVANATWTPWIVSVGGGGGGDVTKVGTPVNNQVGIWTGDGTLEGDVDLTFDGTILTTGLTGRVRTGVGTVSQAAFGFATEINTGIYRQGTGSLGITLSGAGNWLFQAASFFANVGSGPQMMFEAATATNPTFVPRLSDTDTGIGSAAADQVSIIAGGAEGFRVAEAGAVITNTIFGNLVAAGGGGAGPMMKNEGPSSTNPVFVPNQADPDTGLSRTGVDRLGLIAGGLQCLSVRETGGARQVGFYTTTPISLQTGVAVSSAGIHAALVALGLITA